MKRTIDVLLALFAAVLCHGGFALAVGLMGYSLASGLQNGHGGAIGGVAWLGNLALGASFPLLHSALLTGSGRRTLERLVPGPRGRKLAITTFVVIASVQLVLIFELWSPTHVVWHAPSGVLGTLQWILFAASWLYLARAIVDAGAGLQSGAIGWWALLRDRAPRFGPVPTRGLFRTCRQPIYLGFLLVLLSAPTWSPDHLALCALWAPYCVLAPRFKERRFAAIYGDAFLDYQRSVPYFLPRLRRRTFS